MHIHYQIISYDSPEYHQTVKLRDEVLRRPLNLHFNPEDLLKDQDSIIIAGFSVNKIIATGMLVPKKNKLQMRQVAVNPLFQGKGIGASLLNYCETYAKEQHVEEIFLHARVNVLNFYLKHGYQTSGEIFEEVTIPHIKMFKRL